MPHWDIMISRARYWVTDRVKNIHLGFWLLVIGFVISTITIGWYWGLLFAWHRLHHHLLWTIGYTISSMLLIGILAELDS